MRAKKLKRKKMLDFRDQAPGEDEPSQHSSQRSHCHIFAFGPGHRHRLMHLFVHLDRL